MLHVCTLWRHILLKDLYLILFGTHRVLCWNAYAASICKLHVQKQKLFILGCQWHSDQQRKQWVLLWEDVLWLICSDTSLPAGSRKLRTAVAMAETEEKEEINYASVVFKTKNHPPPEGTFRGFLNSPTKRYFKRRCWYGSEYILAKFVQPGLKYASSFICYVS